MSSIKKPKPKEIKGKQASKKKRRLAKPGRGGLRRTGEAGKDERKGGKGTKGGQTERQILTGRE